VKYRKHLKFITNSQGTVSFFFSSVSSQKQKCVTFGRLTENYALVSLTTFARDDRNGNCLTNRRVLSHTNMVMGALSSQHWNVYGLDFQHNSSNVYRWFSTNEPI